MASAAELQILITGDSRSAQKAMRDMSKSADKFGEILGGVTKVAGGFLAANLLSGASSKVMGFLNDSVSAASDLGESINAVNVVFGESAKEILEWGKTASTQVGLSQRAFNQLATPLGAMLKNAGIQDFTTQTIELTKRAADMASVFNTDVNEALGAITAAIRGETDPIERYGVSVNAAKVELQALAMTGKTTAASLTDQEKSAARLALIFEQTKAVAGDFGNTSDQLANKTRIQQARMEELQATIGQKLLPVQLKLTEAKMAFINYMITTGIPTLEALYARHWPAIERVINEKVIPALQAAAPVFVFLAEHAIEKTKGMIQVIESVAEIVDRVVSGVKAVIDGDWRTAWDEFSGIPAAAWELLQGSFSAALGNLPDLLYDLGRNAIQGFLNGLKAKWEDVKNWLSDAVTDIPDKFMSIFKMKSPSRLMYDLGENTMQGYLNGLQAKQGEVQSFVGGLFGTGGAESTTAISRPGPGIRLSGTGGGTGHFAPVGGRPNVVVNVHIAGSIRSDRELAGVIRDQLGAGGLRGVL